MAWRKSPPELIELFDAVAPSKPPAVRRKMFGYPCVFANDNMFAGLHQESMILRLPEAERVRFLKQQGAAIFEPMPGRVMREYVSVPPQLMADRDRLREWMQRSFAYAVELPNKAKAKRSAARTSASKKPARAVASKASPRKPVAKKPATKKPAKTARKKAGPRKRAAPHSGSRRSGRS